MTLTRSDPIVALDLNDMTTVLAVAPDGQRIASFVQAVRRDDRVPFSLTKLRKKDEWKSGKWTSRFHGASDDRALYQVRVVRPSIGPRVPRGRGAIGGALGQN